MSSFGYLLDKFKDADFAAEPFKHLHIEEFLSPEHFEAIVTAKQIATTRSNSCSGLLDVLEDTGYKIIEFPGCVTNKRAYLDWYEGKSKRKVHNATEGFGLVFRLADFADPILSDFHDFMTSPELQEVLMDKFELDADLTIDAGLQKYLHGYEISPHPDIRRKALTWMLNINPGAQTEQLNIHTHYLKFKPEWSFIYEFWKHNPQFDRCWVPWEWGETVKMQPTNNSIVIFSPSNNTLHGVKAFYDHLSMQRTQFYGNLWYEKTSLPMPQFEQFMIGVKTEDEPVAQATIKNLKGAARRMIGLKSLADSSADVKAVRKIDL